MVKLGRPLRDVDEFCDILDAFQKVESNPQIFDCAARLAKSIQEHLHDRGRFRTYLLNIPRLMLRMIKNGTRQPDACITNTNACA